MMFSTYLDNLQQEVGKWADTNFGRRLNGRIPFGPLTGMGEEIGELLFAIYRPVETSAGLPVELQFNLQEYEKEVVDAIGDIMVYMADFAYTLREPSVRIGLLYLNITRHQSVEKKEPVDLCISYGKLQHHYLKLVQGIRGTHRDHVTGIENELSNIMWTLCNLSKQMGFNFEEAVIETWSKVQKRNWNVNQLNGESDEVPGTETK